MTHLNSDHQTTTMGNFGSRATARERAVSARARQIAAPVGLLLFLLAVIVVALPANALPVARADTTTAFCGQEVTNVDPSYDLAGLLQMTEQGNNQIVSAIVGGTGLGAEWCGPVQWITQVAAEVVADGAVLDVVGIHTPTGVDIAVAAAKTTIDDAQQGQGATLPDVGGSGAPIWAPVAWATAGINIRPEPDTSAQPIGGVPDGVPLLLQCSTYGQSVASAGGTTSVWDQITYNGVTGYVADAFIDTGQLTPAVPSC
jgi:hypothetical protein